MYNIRATLKESKIGGYLIQPEISIDEKDISILNVLLENSRLSCRQISKRTGYSISTVINRIKKLEESGIIRRYTLDIDFTKLGYDFPVIIDVRVSEGKLLEVEQEIAKNPHVIAVYDITGEFDVSVYAIFKNRHQLDTFVKNLQKMKYVERTNTKLVLNAITKQSKIIK